MTLRLIHAPQIERGDKIAWTCHEDGRLVLNIKPPENIRLKHQYSFDACFDDKGGGPQVAVVSQQRSGVPKDGQRRCSGRPQRNKRHLHRIRPNR